MKKKKVKLIELNKLDNNTIMMIRNWRNQDYIRASSLTQEVIPEETHKKWIASMKKDENRHLFVCYFDEEPIGVFQLRYDPEAKNVECGEYVISEEYQALGYGAILQYLEAYTVFEIFKYPKSWGVVLATNSRNLRLQKRHQKDLMQNRTTVLVDGEPQEAVFVEGTLEDWKNRRVQNEKLMEHFIEQAIEVVM